jgi:hypothetical protein
LIAVTVHEEDVLTVVAALDDMVCDAGNHDSRKSWHGRTLPEKHAKGNWKVVPVPTLVARVGTPVVFPAGEK